MARKDAILGTPDASAVAPWEGAGAEGQALPAAAAGGEVEVLEGDVETSTPAVQALYNWMVHEVNMSQQDTLTGLESIVSDILRGADAVTVLRETLPVSGQKCVGRPFVLNGYTLVESDMVEGDGPYAYASMRVVFEDTQEPGIINCGGWVVLAQLYRLDQLGALPVRVEIAEGKAKGGKNPPLRLREL